ncbi:MAG: hypothetical protein GQ569_00560 [Methylococcaceae bacterium]|nr:hypothetical protein [Methylococcaceae bacterium]
MKRLLYILIFIYSFLLVGCATKINHIEASYNSVAVNLNDNSSDLFYLKSSTNSILSKAKAQGTKIIFFVPETSVNSGVNGCYFISRQNGEIVNFNHSDNNGFSNPLLSDYLNHSQKINSAKNTLATTEAAIADYTLQYRNAINVLNSNPAFKRGQCVELYSMDKPILACEPVEREAKSKAICLVKNLGCDGFAGLTGSVIGSMIGRSVVALLSDVGCDMISNELLEEENSVIADVAKNTALAAIGAWGGLWGKAIVLGAKVLDYNECVDAVETKCAEKYNAWRNEPIKLQQQCQNQINMSANIPHKIENLKATLNASATELNTQHNKINQLKNKNLNLTADCIVR